MNKMMKLFLRNNPIKMFCNKKSSQTIDTESSMNSSNFAAQDLASQFKNIKEAPYDLVHRAVTTFQSDKNPGKINLCVGAYKCQKGKPHVFDVVVKAQTEMIKNPRKEYTKDLYQPFIQAAKLVMFGKESKFLKDQRIITLQTASGTSALHLGFHLISNFLPHTPRTVYLSNPTWTTHPDIIQTTGLKVGWYPYYNPETKAFDSQKMVNFLKTVEPGSFIVLQVSGHNPTGCDPSKQQWKEICQVMKKRNLVPFFDSAYQGFTSGDLDQDAWAVRYFLEQGFLMLIAQTFSKNIGLYGDRIGALHIVAPDKQSAWNAYSHVRSQIRKIYLCPPSHGSYIVEKVVNDPEYYQNWIAELNQVVESIRKGRKLLRDELERIGTPGSWKHITDQTGMFSFSGLTERQCEILIKKHNIHLLLNGRIAISMINRNNYKRIAQCIKMAIEETLNEKSLL